jgi:hypothetical protein
MHASIDSNNNFGMVIKEKSLLNAQQALRVCAD